MPKQYPPTADLREMSDTHWIAPDLEDPRVTWTWFKGPGGWDERSKTAPATDQHRRYPPGSAARSGWPGSIVVERADRRYKRPAERLTYMTRIAFTAVEGVQLEAEADRRGISLSALVRSLALVTLDAASSEPRVDSIA